MTTHKIYFVDPILLTSEYIETITGNVKSRLIELMQGYCADETPKIHAKNNKVIAYCGADFEYHAVEC